MVFFLTTKLKKIKCINLTQLNYFVKFFISESMFNGNHHSVYKLLAVKRCSCVKSTLHATLTESETIHKRFYQIGFKKSFGA